MRVASLVLGMDSHLHKLVGRTKLRCPTQVLGREYDYSKSTQANYAISPGEPVVNLGTFKSIRDRLDISYHGCYTPARQLLQDELIRQVVESVSAQQTWPWIVFTAGAMGAGKSRTVHWMADKGYFPLADIVQIDPDLFRTVLPEWPEYVARDPLSAGSHTRREAGYLVEIAQEVALDERKHVWVDGSLRDASWYIREFQQIRNEHPEFQIAILHVTADEKVIRRRIALRAAKTGRQVPEAEILDSLKRVPQSVHALATAQTADGGMLCDFVAEIDNSGPKPQLRRFLERGECRASHSEWQEIEQRFRTVPYEDISLKAQN